MAGFKKQHCKKCGKLDNTIDGLCVDCWTKSTLAFYDKYIAKDIMNENAAGIYDKEKARLSLGNGNFSYKQKLNYAD